MSAAQPARLPLDAARSYLKRGWRPIPVPRGSKNPGVDGWARLRLAERELPARFGPDTNVGVLNGEPSGWLVDVDCDVPEARDAADIFLPPTGLIHGRQGNPNSHHWYVVTGPVKTRHFRFGEQRLPGPDHEDGGGKEMLVELRSTGSQTLVPPSVHPSGGTYRWEREQEPAVVAPEHLERAVARLASCALLARHWPDEGSRDHASMALAGMLLRAGWSEEETDQFVCEVASRAHDEEWRNRNKARGTADALRNGERVTGATALAGLLRDGERVVKTVREWLGLPRIAELVWDAPMPLPGTMPPVDPLDLELLPTPLRAWIKDMAERMWVVPDYHAVCAVVVAGAIIGRRVGIHPKRYDDWPVVPNLWGAVVAGPSRLKSAILGEVIKPLARLEMAARAEYAEALAQHEVEVMRASAQRAALEDKMKRAAKAGNTGELDELAAHARLDAPRKPAARRYSTNDATVEKLAELMIDNPDGILVHRDELTGWLRTMDKQGHETDRDFHKEAWNGLNGYEIDRIGRGSQYVPALCESVLGGIQPGPLAAYVYEASDPSGERNDGLLQRFQLIVWPDAPTGWQNVDRWPDTKAKQRAYKIYEALAALDPVKQCNAALSDSNDGHAIPMLRFDDAAQTTFDEWRTQLEHRLLDPTLPPAYEAHLGKYRSLMPCLALIFHVIMVVDPDATEAERPTDASRVCDKAAKLAAAWCEYLESHLRRVYGSALDPALERARALLGRIQRGQVQDGMKVRDIYRPHWERLETPEEVESAIKTLADYGWVQTETITPHTGRPSAVIRIHPQLAAS